MNLDGVPDYVSFPDTKHRYSLMTTTELRYWTEKTEMSWFVHGIPSDDDTAELVGYHHVMEIYEFMRDELSRRGIK